MIVTGMAASVKAASEGGEKLGEFPQASEERRTHVKAKTGCNHTEQKAKQAENGEELECLGFSVEPGNVGKDASNRSNHRNSL